MFFCDICSPFGHARSPNLAQKPPKCEASSEVKVSEVAGVSQELVDSGVGVKVGHMIKP